MKEKFKKPVMEVIEFDPEDVIVTSCTTDYCGFDCKKNCRDICYGDREFDKT